MTPGCISDRHKSIRAVIAQLRGIAVSIDDRRQKASIDVEEFPLSVLERQCPRRCAGHERSAFVCGCRHTPHLAIDSERPKGPVAPHVLNVVVRDYKYLFLEVCSPTRTEEPDLMTDLGRWPNTVPRSSESHAPSQTGKREIGLFDECIASSQRYWLGCFRARWTSFPPAAIGGQPAFIAAM